MSLKAGKRFIRVARHIDDGDEEQSDAKQWTLCDGIKKVRSLFAGLDQHRETL